MSETLVTTEDQVVITDDLDAFSTDFFGQKADKTEKTNSEVEQEPDDSGEVADKEAQKTDVDADDVEIEEPKEAPKKKTVQDRIDELVRQREDVKRESDARIEALRKEFEEKIASLTPKAAAPKSAEPDPNDTNEDGTPKYDLGEFDPQYIRDLTRYTLNQERAQAAEQAEVERKNQDALTEKGNLQAEWNTKVEAATADMPDFVEKGRDLLNNFNDLPPAYGEYLTGVLMSMDKGPDVLYYLSNNPEEAIKIVNSGAQKATLALGRIEAKFLEADAQKTLAKPKISKAPPPPPVRSRGTNGAFISVAPDTDDLDAFSSAFFSTK